MRTKERKKEDEIQLKFEKRLKIRRKLKMLTTDTVADYVAGLGLARFAGAALSAREMEGGNLNYAWRVAPSASDAAAATSAASVFVKQAPPYIKCLGAGAPLTQNRVAMEAEAMRAFFEISPDHAPEILHFDAERHVMVLE